VAARITLAAILSLRSQNVAQLHEIGPSRIAERLERDASRCRNLRDQSRLGLNSRAILARRNLLGVRNVKPVDLGDDRTRLARVAIGIIHFRHCGDRCRVGQIESAIRPSADERSDDRDLRGSVIRSNNLGHFSVLSVSHRGLIASGKTVLGQFGHRVNNYFQCALAYTANFSLDTRRFSVLKSAQGDLPYCYGKSLFSRGAFLGLP
jgi:hypothetical protein